MNGGPCECLARYGAACTGMCTQEIMPAVLEGCCPNCHARLATADGTCPNGHGYWAASVDCDGNGSYSWGFDIHNPFDMRRSVGFTATGVDPDVFDILTGEQP